MKGIQEEIVSISVISEPLSGYYRLLFLGKEWIKKLLFPQTYGPKAVLDSIIKGLNETPGVVWNHNPKEDNLYDIVYVPIGVETLKYALNLKNKGKIKKLIVGPNISIPLSKDDIFFDARIDVIVVPSQWLQEYFYSLLGQRDARIIIIPAGVDIAEAHQSSGEILLYKKHCPEHLFIATQEFLEKNRYQYTLFTYGEFQNVDFLQALDHAQCLIYLQTSESQGIALQEAWMRDVPTLVWNQGYWEYKGRIWKDSHISAPYLTDECGMFFSTEDDFPESFRLFFEQLSLYSPRKYCLKNFTHAGTIEKLLTSLS